MAHATMPRPALTVLTGPTAAGKTELALAWARRDGAEIVSADSMQVYRGLDVGTAKPTPAQRAAVPHHVIDVADPDESFSAARFCEMADAAIAGIAARGRPVIVAGGTQLYLRALLRGLHAAPPADPSLRAALAGEPLDRLRERLAAVDPESARRIHPHDRVRLVRALEITLGGGTPASRLRDDHGFREARYPFRMFALVPPADLLRTRIAARVERMMADGLLDETRALLARGNHPPPLRALGYRHAAAHLRGEQSLAEATTSCVRDTRAFARRQLAWLRGEPEVRYLERPDSMPEPRPHAPEAAP
jgi:tRNA dimethylallyltransferase